MNGSDSLAIIANVKCVRTKTVLNINAQQIGSNHAFKEERLNAFARERLRNKMNNKNSHKTKIEEN
jgi:hypothetical protein